MNGKGSAKRPATISDKEFDERWSNIDWGDKKPQTPPEEKKTKKGKEK